MKKLFVQESINEFGTKWYLSFGIPVFQNTEFIEIDEFTAKRILQLQKVGSL